MATQQQTVDRGAHVKTRPGATLYQGFQQQIGGRTQKPGRRLSCHGVSSNGSWGACKNQAGGYLAMGFRATDRTYRADEEEDDAEDGLPLELQVVDVVLVYLHLRQFANPAGHPTFRLMHPFCTVAKGSID